MREAFDKARRAAEAKDLRSHKDWNGLREIERRADELQRLEKKRHKEQYSDRVAKEYERLLRDKYSPTKDYKPNGVSDSNDLQRQAEKNVRKRHEERMSWIDRSKGNVLDQHRHQARASQEQEKVFARPTAGHEGFALKREFRRER